jgi:four helix bundle protein
LRPSFYGAERRLYLIMERFEAAESRKDFVHKLRICLKELRETKRWLRFATRLKKFGHIPDLPACLTEVDELIRIFAASIRTAERNAK